MKIIKQNINNNIKYLFNSKWFIKSFHFLNTFINNYNLFSNTDNANIIFEKVNKSDLLNIIDELNIFLNNDKYLILLKSKINNTYLEDLKNTINKCLKYQSVNNKSNLLQTNKLRLLLDVNINGKIIKQHFFENLKQLNKIDNHSELLLNPYTSILNLNEIYLQVDYHLSFELSFNYNDRIFKLDMNDIILFIPNKHKLVTYILDLDTLNIKKKIKYQKYINNYIVDITSRIFLIQYLANSINKPKPITIFLISYKKEFMNSNEELIKFTSNEINTGVTNGIQIIITREEEVMKTLIHECIHFYDLDFRNIPKYITKWIFGNFNLISYIGDNINENVYIFEAYTEFVASILHILTRTIPNNTQLKTNNTQLEIVKTNNKQLKTNNKQLKTNNTQLKTNNKQLEIDNFIKKQYLIIFENQVIYTFNKLAQILAISKCENLKQFNTNSDKCELHEATNVFSYYYLKLSLYMNIGKTLEVMDNNAKFIDKDKSFKQLLNIFKLFTKNNKISNYINILITKYYKQINYNKTKNSNTKNKIKTKKIQKKKSFSNLNKSLKMVIIE